MELLVNPGSLSVYPEPGPNMMWNLDLRPHRRPSWNRDDGRMGKCG